MYVAWEDTNGEFCLSRMAFWKAIIVHLSGFGKIVPRSKVSIEYR